MMEGYPHLDQGGSYDGELYVNPNVGVDAYGLPFESSEDNQLLMSVLASTPVSEQYNLAYPQSFGYSYGSWDNNMYHPHANLPNPPSSSGGSNPNLTSLFSPSSSHSNHTSSPLISSIHPQLHRPPIIPYWNPNGPPQSHQINAQQTIVPGLSQPNSLNNSNTYNQNNQSIIPSSNNSSSQGNNLLPPNQPISLPSYGISRQTISQIKQENSAIPVFSPNSSPYSAAGTPNVNPTPSPSTLSQSTSTPNSYCSPIQSGANYINIHPFIPMRLIGILKQAQNDNNAGTISGIQHNMTPPIPIGPIPMTTQQMGNLGNDRSGNNPSGGSGHSYALRSHSHPIQQQQQQQQHHQQQHQQQQQQQQQHQQHQQYGVGSGFESSSPPLSDEGTSSNESPPQHSSVLMGGVTFGNQGSVTSPQSNYSNQSSLGGGGGSSSTSRKSSTNNSVSHENLSADEDDETTGPRNRRRESQNRASRNYRQRKKAYIKEMEAKLDALTLENEILRNENLKAKKMLSQYQTEKPAPLLRSYSSELQDEEQQIEKLVSELNELTRSFSIPPRPDDGPLVNSNHNSMEDNPTTGISSMLKGKQGRNFQQQNASNNMNGGDPNSLFHGNNANNTNITTNTNNNNGQMVASDALKEGQLRQLLSNLHFRMANRQHLLSKETMQLINPKLQEKLVRLEGQPEKNVDNSLTEWLSTVSQYVSSSQIEQLAELKRRHFETRAAIWEERTAINADIKEFYQQKVAAERLSGPSGNLDPSSISTLSQKLEALKRNLTREEELNQGSITEFSNILTPFQEAFLTVKHYAHYKDNLSAIQMLNNVWSALSKQDK